MAVTTANMLRGGAREYEVSFIPNLPKEHRGQTRCERGTPWRRPRSGYG
jgi:hypothetical protein